MKKRIAPWTIALVSAAVIHMLFIAVLDNTHWLHFGVEQNSVQSSFEVSLLPANGAEKKQSKAIVINQDAETTDIEQQINLPGLQGDTNRNSAIDSSNSNLMTESNTPHVDISQIEKPALLDLSKISLSSDAKSENLNGVFSPTLQAQIEESQEAQREYLKGQVKEVDYPITEDADGTRYVNIKGVCWRIPKEGSDEGWVIVFAGCNGQTESFHFELNITPSTLLGPSSPFSLGQ
ncbi:hypothetical protein [Marinomonas transparens]|uniref:Uncharacterized protein n=1 Tax=Marinomonas transparens TaxID=2795388 RepID=A0A934N080_9GAMM|nr:hypothetical protein [Marinomonas transparens]MBJ7538300.1 hypothetical protein [Marinomonas transparens]